MNEDKLKIVKLSDLIKKYSNNLKIPDYQRPYTWKKSTADYSCIKIILEYV